MPTNRRIVLASRPEGAATTSIKLEEEQLPALQPGQVLVRNLWLSLDPYMRGRMNEGRSYTAAQPLNEVMGGGTAGEVKESRNPAFAPGDKVVGYLGWQEYGISDGKGLYKVDARQIPRSACLGAVGMPGVTAWYGELCALHGPAAVDYPAHSANWDACHRQGGRGGERRNRLQPIQWGSSRV